MSYTLVASPVFKLSLQRLIYFLEKKYTQSLANKTKRTIRKGIEKGLLINPKVAPISPRLIELGINEYRQLLVDKHNLVFFRIEEANKRVILLAVMDSRQSIGKLLSEINLLV